MYAAAFRFMSRSISVDHGHHTLPNVEKNRATQLLRALEGVAPHGKTHTSRSAALLRTPVRFRTGE
jgi:hypothetical protein